MIATAWCGTVMGRRVISREGIEVTKVTVNRTA